MAYNLTRCNDFVNRTCPVCKKKFYATSVWAYYIGERVAGKTFCSWKCIQAYRARQQESKRVGREKRELILSLAREGYSDDEVGRMVGVSGPLVRYYRLKEEKETGEAVRCEHKRGRKAGS